MKNWNKTKELIVCGLVSVCLLLTGAILQVSYFYIRNLDVDVNSQLKERNKQLIEMNILVKKLQDQILSVTEENSKLKNHTLLLEKKVDYLKSVVPPSDKDMEILIRTKPNEVTQGIEPNQLRSMIKTVLSYLGEKNSKWVDLLMITGQAESHSGRYTKQVKGPAVGIFQIEPATEKEVWKYYINRNRNIKDKILALRFPASLGKHEMEYNIAYSVAVTYCIYKWRNVNPDKMSIAQLTLTHKEKYNTILGAASVKGTVKKIRGSGIL